MVSENNEWACARCTALNSTDVSQCMVCFLEKESDEGSSLDASKWQCTSCTMFSHELKDHCETCGLPRRDCTFKPSPAGEAGCHRTKARNHDHELSKSFPDLHVTDVLEEGNLETHYFIF